MPEQKTQQTDHTSKESKGIKLPVRWMLAVAALAVIVPWLIYTPAGLMGKADAVGYAICHQIPARSFQINGQPISLCARCTGMYVGVFVGMVYQMLLGRRRAEWPGRGALIVFGLLFLAFAVDGSNSAATLFLGSGPLYEPSNTSRLITGTGMGLVMAGMVLPTWHQTLWKEYDPRPYFLNWRQFAGYLLTGAVSIGLILTEQPLVLRVITYLGVSGVVGILTMLYTMIVVSIFAKENAFSKPVEIVSWLLAGVTIAFLHLGAIDLVRFFLTGTWEGFHL